MENDWEFRSVPRYFDCNRRQLLKNLGVLGLSLCLPTSPFRKGLAFAEPVPSDSLPDWLQALSPIQKVSKIADSTTGTDGSAHFSLGVNSAEAPIHFLSPFGPVDTTETAAPVHVSAMGGAHGRPPIQDPDEEADLVIVGGGISGLSTAYLLKIKNRFSWSGKILSAGILKASRGKESITPWALHILQNRNRATHWTPSFIRRSVYPNYGERLPMIPSSTEIGLFLIFGRVPPIPKTPGILSTRRSISSTY